MVAMDSLANSGVSFPIFLAYGLLILIYIFILRLLLNLLQQMGDKHSIQRSVVDRDIHQTMTHRVETSMHAFDVYGIAIVIAKGGIATITMATIIIILVIKFGLIVTAFLVSGVVLTLWAINHWLSSLQKPGSLRAEMHKFFQNAGGVGTIITLSIVLVVLIFLMIFIH